MKYAPPRLDDSWLQTAAAAEARGDLEDALRLWCAYRLLHPTVADGYLEPCRALRKAGRLAEAQAILDQGSHHEFAASLPAMMEVARIAEAGDDRQAALRCWQAAAAAFPRHGGCNAAVGRLLLKLDRQEEAEAVIAAALARMPHDPMLLRQSAQLATARADWPEALRRWDLVLARNPADQAAARSRGIALRNMNSAAPRRAAPDPHPAQVAP
jgi:tetratricopeptide (TPR) repeat protein